LTASLPLTPTAKYFPWLLNLAEYTLLEKLARQTGLRVWKLYTVTQVELDATEMSCPSGDQLT
jgi:hypothetical protein